MAVQVASATKHKEDEEEMYGEKMLRRNLNFTFLVGKDGLVEKNY